MKRIEERRYVPAKTGDAVAERLAIALRDAERSRRSSMP
jgi:hypothetical protein